MFLNKAKHIYMNKYVKDLRKTEFSNAEFENLQHGKKVGLY